MVVMVAVVWLLTSVVGSSPGAPQPATARLTLPPTPAAPSDTPAPSTAGTATAPSATAAVAPTQPPTAPRPAPVVLGSDGVPVPPCSDSAVEVRAESAAPGYPRGTQPVFRLLFSNTSTEPCALDVSPNRQQVVVYRAADKARVWSSSDCSPGTTTEARALAPGEQVVYSAQWSTNTSTEGCATPRTPVPPDRYLVMAVLGARQSPPVPFAIVE